MATTLHFLPPNKLSERALPRRPHPAQHSVRQRPLSVKLPTKCATRWVYGGFRKFILLRYPPYAGATSTVIGDDPQYTLNRQGGAFRLHYARISGFSL